MASLRSRPLRARSIGRAAAGALLALSVVLHPMAAAARQSEEPAPGMIRDAEIESILRAEADPILRAAGLNPADIPLNIVQSDELNAGASGRQIFLFTGMILAADNPGELRGVIAHEAGHVAGGHSARSGDMMRAGLPPFLVALALGVLAAAAGRPDAGAAIATSGGYFATLNILTYSRAQEGAADQAAASYLETAGMSGRGLVSFFNKYRFQEVFSQSRRYRYFQSHPISSERIAALRTRVEASRHRDVPFTPEQIARHALMRVKIEAFLRPASWTLGQYPESDRSFNARYARAIAYYRDANPNRSVQIIDELIAEQPNNPYLHELKGQVLFENGRTAEAVAPYRRAVELAPDSALLRIGYAQTLVAVGGASVSEALPHLRQALQRENDNLLGWRLLGQVYDATGQAGLARLAAAEEHFHGNDAAGARLFAIRARQLLTAGTPEYRRATDIVMSSSSSERELREIANEERQAG